MRKLILVALAGCVLWSPLCLESADEHETESKFMALERLVRVQAIPGKDLNILNVLLADNMVRVTLEGRSQTKAEFLTELQSLDALHYEIHDMVVRLHGDTVAVTGLFQMSGVRQGKPFVRQGRFLDTWLNDDGRWLIIASLSTPAKDPQGRW